MYFQIEPVLTSGKPPARISSGPGLDWTPVLSVTRAVREWRPTGTLLQARVYGGAVSSPSLLAPAKNSTRATVPSGSDAMTLRATFVPGANAVPGNGLV